MLFGLTPSRAQAVAGAAMQPPVVERHLPPEPPHRAPVIQLGGGEDLYKSDDVTPLGADLRAIVLIGVKTPVAKRMRKTGLDVEHIDGIDAPAVRARLEPLIGQPLSRKLIADIQSAIAAVYREAGHPFVSVTLPPQEVTGGVLQLRVFEFKAGQMTVKGGAPESYPADRIHMTPGQPIDARRLETDLDWANRNPFRQVEAVFGPGKDLAVTNLTVQETRQFPFQAFGGYTNSGTRLTDRDRFFVGATAAPFTSLPAPFGDVFASFQLTGSKDFWATNDRLLDDTGTARYVSPAGRIVVPLWWRASLELTGDYVQTNERPTDPFRVRTRTAEGSAVYRQAASDLLPFAFGDILAGFELKGQQRATFFDEVDVADGKADVAQWLVGWNGRWSDRLGTNTLDARLKTNSGGVLAYNNSADWSLYTNGRVTDIDNTFVTLTYNRQTPVFDLSLRTEVIALLSGKPLPDTERVALGGNDEVRGYVTEDGTVDQAVIVRDSLYLPSFSIAQRLGAPLKDTLSPFVLADVGWGRDIFLNQSTTLASAGVGFDYQIGPSFSSTLSAAVALRNGLDTPAGAWRIQARAVVSY